VKPHTLKLDRKFIVFDLETTGVESHEDRIVQMAMHIFRPDGTVDEWTSLVNPLRTIPEGATKVHGITNDMVKDAPTFKSMAGNLHGGFTNADFGGYNVKFDLRFMVAEFQRCSLTFQYHEGIRVLDGFRMWQVSSPRTLGDAYQHW